MLRRWPCPQECGHDNGWTKKNPDFGGKTIVFCMLAAKLLACYFDTISPDDQTPVSAINNVMQTYQCFDQMIQMNRDIHRPTSRLRLSEGVKGHSYRHNGRQPAHVCTHISVTWKTTCTRVHTYISHMQTYLISTYLSSWHIL